MLKVDLIVGVRPDFIRAAALMQAFSTYEDLLDVRIIHTGQHYDPVLNQDLLDQLDLQSIHAFLACQGPEGAPQLASIMIAYEEQLRMDPANLVLIIGNSNSALSCSLVAARQNIQIAHIDAGIRSYDSSHIEEQNDMLIDRLSSILFTSNEESVVNLIRDGFDSSQIIELGNIRSDAVFMNLGFAEDSNALEMSGLQAGAYILVTLHHNHILKERDFIVSLFTLLEELSERIMIYVTLHPKAAMQLEDIPELMLESTDNFQIVDSRNYHDMLKLLKNAALVITDSQGIQEESTLLGVQCLTPGNTTNRPITLTKGTNTLVGFDVNNVRSSINSIVEGKTINAYPIDGWDGKAGQRIAKHISGIS